MTEDTGVIENVADSQNQQEVEQQSSQEYNWKAVNESLAQQKQDNNTVRQQLQEANNLIQQFKAEKEQQELGDPDDYATVGKVENRFKEKEAVLNQRLEYLEAKLSHPDYDDVINTHYMELAKENPRLNESVVKSPNASLIAYQLGKSRMEAKQKVKKDVDRVVENSKKPASINTAVGGGTSAMTQADKIASMSRDDFEKHVAKVMRNQN